MAQTRIRCGRLACAISVGRRFGVANSILVVTALARAARDARQGDDRRSLMKEQSSLIAVVPSESLDSPTPALAGLRVRPTSCLDQVGLDALRQPLAQAQQPAVIELHRLRQCLGEPASSRAPSRSGLIAALVPTRPGTW